MQFEESQRLRVGQRHMVDSRAAVTVQLTVLVEDLGASLEPHWLLEGHTVAGQQLWGDAS